LQQRAPMDTAAGSQATIVGSLLLPRIWLSRNSRHQVIISSTAGQTRFRALQQASSHHRGQSHAAQPAVKGRQRSSGHQLNCRSDVFSRFASNLLPPFHSPLSCQHHTVVMYDVLLSKRKKSHHPPLRLFLLTKSAYRSLSTY